MSREQEVDYLHGPRLRSGELPELHVAIDRATAGEATQIFIRPGQLHLFEHPNRGDGLRWLSPGLAFVEEQQSAGLRDAGWCSAQVDLSNRISRPEEASVAEQA